MATDYHPKKKDLSTSKLYKCYLKLRLEDKIKPIFLIIEESENLIGETLDQVVSEGRKTGIFTCLLTTYPAQLGGSLLIPNWHANNRKNNKQRRH